MNNNYYTYAYLREDGTPYYIGKGRGKRIDNPHYRNNKTKVRVPLPPKERRIYLKQNLNEDGAYKHEKYMISVFGRKDLKTGILLNMDDGGRGGSSSPRFSTRGERNPMWRKPSAQRGKIWITNNTENKMVFPDQIPEGWYSGRTKVHNESGKESLKQKMRKDNPNAKKYRIIFRDGTEKIVHQLSTWARENGHTYNSIKALVRRTRYKKEMQFECYNSPTYYIKEIWALESASVV
jgi:hypothetical protein